MHVENLVKSALANTLQRNDVDNISNHDHLKQDLRLDSMSSIMFLMKLEETINGFYVDPETLRSSDLETVGTVVNYINTQLVVENDAIH